MPEEEEEEVWLPLSMTDLATTQAEARALFQETTGYKLPTLPDIAVQARVIRPCQWIQQGIPEGPLFYPCCGSDIDDALHRFGPFVTACHFADPYHPPLVKRGIENFRRIEVPDIGNVLLGNGKSWDRSSDRHPCPVVVHQKDGLLTLLQDIKNLAVFYYRGDSSGEGGSDQRWLFPVLFEIVLTKLMEGGIVCTDGSNSNCWDDNFGTYSPFIVLGGNPPPFLPKPKVGDRIVYGPRTLECIAEVEASLHARRMLAWRVTSHIAIAGDSSK